MITEIPSGWAVEHVKGWHYSGSASPGVIRYGWYDDMTGLLLAVSIYNTGFRDMQVGVFGAEHADKVLHHHRLAVNPAVLPRPKVVPFLKRCNRLLAAQGYWALVTYADKVQGHTGEIYRMSGAQYTGIVAKGNLFFRDTDGAMRTVSSGLGKTWSERRRKAAELGWTEERTPGRHRYVYMLGSGAERRERRKMLRWPILPAPTEGGPP